MAELCKIEGICFLKYISYNSCNSVKTEGIPEMSWNRSEFGSNCKILKIVLPVDVSPELNIIITIKV